MPINKKVFFKKNMYISNMKKEVYQLEFPWWNEIKKKGSIINELRTTKNHGKRKSYLNNYDYNRSLRGISQKHTKNR